MRVTRVNVVLLYVWSPLCRVQDWSLCVAIEVGNVTLYTNLDVICDSFHGDKEQKQIGPLIYWVLGNKLPIGLTLNLE